MMNITFNTHGEERIKMFNRMYSRGAWLQLTDQYVAVVQAFRQATPEQRILQNQTKILRAAKTWLTECGFDGFDCIEHYLANRANFNSAGDLPRTTRCIRCGKRLHATRSILCGIGTECRRK